MWEFDRSKHLAAGAAELSRLKLFHWQPAGKDNAAVLKIWQSNHRVQFHHELAHQSRPEM